MLIRHQIVIRALTLAGATVLAACGQGSLPNHPTGPQSVLAPGVVAPLIDDQLEVVQTFGHVLLSSQVQYGNQAPIFGPVVQDDETCDLTGCDGDGNNWLSTTDYKTPGQVSSQKTLYDANGNVMASAAVYASSSSSWNALGKPGSPVIINVNAQVQANAASSDRSSSGKTADSRHSTNNVVTSVTVSSPKQSIMTVTKLVATGSGSVGKLCQPGKCAYHWGSGWTIIITTNGVVTKTYSSRAGGSGTFGPVVIPAGSKVQVGWHASADAGAKGDDGFATGTASVSGTVKLE